MSISDPAAPRTLITGASGGIGEAYARAFAARGDDLILVARSAAKLAALAAELHDRHGVAVTPLAADLADPAAVAGLVAEIERRGLTVDTLINNAGFGAHAPFADVPPERDAEMIALNVAAPVALAHAVLPSMLRRGRGTIVNVGSTASFQPVPYMAIYGATKAFVLSFSAALAEEVRAQGVRVLAICPGQTSTNFFAVAGETARFGRARTTDDVVRTTLRALERGASVAVDGAFNAAFAASTRFVPRSVLGRVGSLLMRPK